MRFSVKHLLLAMASLAAGMVLSDGIWRLMVFDWQRDVGPFSNPNPGFMFAAYVMGLGAGAAIFVSTVVAMHAAAVAKQREKSWMNYL